MADVTTSPSKEALDTHLNSVRFIEGVERGRWQVLNYTWPHLYVRVNGYDPAGGQTAIQDFHLEFEGYPDPGPFIERWAFADETSFGRRPSAPIASTAAPGFVDALKDWSDVANVHGGIYRAWQRWASKHNSWATKRPDEAWHRNRTVVFIMEHLFALVSEQAAWLASRAA